MDLQDALCKTLVFKLAWPGLARAPRRLTLRKEDSLRVFVLAIHENFCPSDTDSCAKGEKPGRDEERKTESKQHESLAGLK